MPSPVKSIQRLPQATRTRLRSTQIITTLSQIISELVQNSLDARASHVDVGLDFEAWECWVRDDGVGMSVGMEGLGSVGMEADGGRYSEYLFCMGLATLSDAARKGTSKTYGSSSVGSASTFGFRGEGMREPAS